MRGLRYVDPDLSIVSLHALNPIATPMTAVYNSGSKNIKNMSNKHLKITSNLKRAETWKSQNSVFKNTPNSSFFSRRYRLQELQCWDLSGSAEGAWFYGFLLCSLLFKL